MNNFMLETRCLLSSIPCLINHYHLLVICLWETTYFILASWFIMGWSWCLSSFTFGDDLAGVSDSIMVEPFTTFWVVTRPTVCPFSLVSICLGPRNFMLLLHMNLDHVERGISPLLKQRDVVKFLLLIVNKSWLLFSLIRWYLVRLVWQVQWSPHYITK